MPAPRLCNFCQVEPASLRCTGCSKAWYCSNYCHRRIWFAHKFKCKPEHKITTADHLLLACMLKMIPTDEQTLIDYGFWRALSNENQFKLLGLYQYLRIHCSIYPKTLRRWAKRGILLEEIKKAYHPIPDGDRGEFYPWLLRNQWVLDGRKPEVPVTEPEPNDSYESDGSDDTDNSDAFTHSIERAGWIYAGGSHTATASQIEDCIRYWPEHKQDCLYLCGYALTGQCPVPATDLGVIWIPGEIWIPFGFCACRSTPFADEMHLSRLYKKLLGLCTFEQFLVAYQSSQLYALFSSKGLANELEFSHLIEGVLKTSPRINLSVWNLKQFVVKELEEDEEDYDLFPSNPVTDDYGFRNCETADDVKGLKAIYKTLFKHTGCDPTDLHRACIEGHLYEYVSNLVRFNRKKDYRRLMASPHPLPWGFSVSYREPIVPPSVGP